MVNSTKKLFFSVKQIFSDNNNWKNYSEKFRNDIRAVEIEEINKMLSCKDLSRGCFEYKCGNCGKIVIVPFGCNSRLCSSCGKRYTDKWANNVVRTTFKKIPYKHLTFSMPEILWKYFHRNMKLYKVMMDAANKTIQEMFSEVAKKEIKVGVIMVLHPFGRDIKFKPHVHPIVTYGGFDGSDEFVKLGSYVNYNVFHKKWQYNLLTALRKYIPKNIIDYCFSNYPKGFVAYIRPDVIWGGLSLAKYIARYVRHPAIAASRIVGYDGRVVKFYYDDHVGKRHFVEMRVEQFIAAIIQHIPEKNMRLIRYYGAHARNQVSIMRKKLKQSVIVEFSEGKREEKFVIYCPDCFEKMDFVRYCVKPPD